MKNLIIHHGPIAILHQLKLPSLMEKASDKEGFSSKDFTCLTILTPIEGYIYSTCRDMYTIEWIKKHWKNVSYLCLWLRRYRWSSNQCKSLNSFDKNPLAAEDVLIFWTLRTNHKTDLWLRKLLWQWVINNGQPCLADLDHIHIADRKGTRIIEKCWIICRNGS